MTIEYSAQRGVFSALKARLQHNRLGELLLANGTITAQQLRDALGIQRSTGQALGTVLKNQGLLTETHLRLTLVEQFAWRALAAGTAFMIGFGALGIQSARATSATSQGSEITYSRRSMPEESDVQPASLSRATPAPAARGYSSLFGSEEVRSADISPFTKWTGIIARLSSSSRSLPSALSSESGAGEIEKLQAVNSYYNRVRYIEDRNNWGVGDYWETPDEFISRGGDCEDFAIAKYAALKALGFREDQLRIAVVQDTWKNLPHAILIVYTSEGAKFLDNQYKDVKDVDGFERYRPVYSINRTGWWRHIG